jgi:signal transduction histidine kinase
MARTRPPALREGDLASAVDGLRADMSARYALTVHVDWPAQAHPLPLSSAITVYRFFQEALINVVKHADMDDAYLTLEGPPTRCSPRCGTRARGSTPRPWCRTAAGTSA